MQKRRLGRGLSALIGSTSPRLADDSGQALMQIPVASVIPNRYQPRVNFDPKKIGELKNSINDKGIIQPIIVNKLPDDSGFELIAGERRLRAVKELGLAEIPAIIKEVDDHELLELALIENLQRENLNPIEEAVAYKRLADEFKFTQTQTAKRLGKNRSTVTNTLRLLNLPEEVQELVRDGELSSGHARPLLSISDPDKQVALANKIVKNGLSVRETETLIQNLTNKSHAKKSARSPVEAHLRDLADELQRNFGTKVNIRKTKQNQGKIEITFYSNDDFERIVERLVTV